MAAQSATLHELKETPVINPKLQVRFKCCMFMTNIAIYSKCFIGNLAHIWLVGATIIRREENTCTPIGSSYKSETSSEKGKD